LYCSFFFEGFCEGDVFVHAKLIDTISTNQDGRILGHIRIRAKTQGIALSLGDKITLKQKSNKALPA
jgi:coatomer subunit beta